MIYAKVLCKMRIEKAIRIAEKTVCRPCQNDSINAIVHCQTSAIIMAIVHEAVDDHVCVCAH